VSSTDVVSATPTADSGATLWRGAERFAAELRSQGATILEIPRSD